MRAPALRARRGAVSVALLTLAALSGAVAWRAAVRASTIPLELDHVVTAKEVRREKHPGVDDVHVLVSRPVDGAVLEEIVVDRGLFGRLAVGDRLRKERGERVLRVGEGAVSLQSSPAAATLGWAALAGILVPVAVLAGAAWRRRREALRGAGVG